MKRTNSKGLKTGITTGIINTLKVSLLTLLMSCSSEYHLQRAILKDPSIVQRDTLIIRDTLQVITNNVSTDSTFILSTDTVVIRKDKLTIKHYYHKDSVYLWGECDSDTIYQPYEKIVPVEKIIYDKGWKPPNWIWWIVILGLILFVLNRFLPKK